MKLPFKLLFNKILQHFKSTAIVVHCPFPQTIIYRQLLISKGSYYGSVYNTYPCEMLWNFIEL